VFVHLAVHLLFTRLSSGVAADQSISAKEESFMRARLSKWRVVSRRVEWRSSTPVHRWLKTRSTCLTDPVTGQFTVEGLIANTLLDRPKNPMLFHTGD
jgi:hypothetical protein